MKQIKQNKWMPIVYGALLVTIGVMMVIFAFVNPGLINSVLGYAIAGALFIVGLTHIIVALVAHTDELFTAALVLGSIAIALGIVLCIGPGIISEVLKYFVASFACAAGAVCLSKGIIFAVFKQKMSWVIGYLCVAIVAITVGILLFCFIGKALTVIYTIMGLGIFGIGIFELVLGIKKLTKNN